MFFKLMIAISALMMLVVYDHSSANGVFPTRFYCMMGAGTAWDRITHMPIRKGGGFRTDTICIHRSLLSGWSARL
jgi:hypothetical protein